MKHFNDVKVGDTIFLLFNNDELQKNKVIEIDHRKYETRFWFYNDYKQRDYWFVYEEDLNKTYSAGVYSCIEALLNAINNDEINNDTDEIF